MTRAILSPQELRARMVASYLDGYRRHGIPHTPEQVERLAVADCELVDRARALGELGDGRPRKRRKDPDPGKRRKTLKEHVAKVGNGARLADGDVEVVRSRTYHGNPMRSDARWSAAVARLRRILEGASGARTLADAAAAIETRLRPLAVSYAEQWALYMARVPYPHRCGDRAEYDIQGNATKIGCSVGPSPARPNQPGNPYCRLSDYDADRMFRRAVEDICDRSTGVLGSWYVK
jgi:hypothetical protein